MQDKQSAKISAQYQNPIWRKAADPWITFYRGFYYGLKTNDNGIIQKANHPGKLEAAPEHYAFKGIPGTELACQFWAPELHRFNEKWYIYTTSSDGNFSKHSVIVFESDGSAPDGTYHFAGKLTDPWGIDATVLTVQKEKYLVWANQDFGEVLSIAPMISPIRLSQERAVIARPEFPWEGSIMEGPVQLPTGPDGPVILVYSANDSRSDDYCLATMELIGNDPMNPAHWRKSGKPFMTKGNQVFGPGHCSFFTDCSGQIWITMHVITESGGSWEKRAGWLQPLIMDGKRPAMNQHPVPSGKQTHVPDID